MLCEKCQKEEASVHVTKIVNGQKTETHLCQHCAKELGEFGLSIDLPNLFASLFDYSPFGGKLAAPKQCHADRQWKISASSISLGAALLCNVQG